MNTLHVWSDIPGQAFKASTESDAVGKSGRETKAGHRTLAERIMSMNDLIRLFNRLANGSDQWGLVNFHTHGSGGSIALGSNSLNLDSVQRLENMDYDRIFAKDCVITFEGCNVAEGAQGEFFLVQIGDTLLSVKGGKVRGNTGAGLGYFGGEESWHPFGSWITATVGPGGTIKFDQLFHLHPDRINQRIVAAADWIRSSASKFQAGEKADLEKCVAQAKAWGTSRWSARFNACLWLDTAESKIETIDQRWATDVHPDRYR